MNNLLSFPPTSISDFIKYLGDQLRVFLHAKNKYSENIIVTVITHLVNFFPCTSECFTIGLIYLNRIEEKYEGYVNLSTIAKLYSTAVLIASKFHDDNCYDNLTFSNVLIINEQQLMKMEVDFLFLLEFTCYFTQTEYSFYFDKLSPGWKNNKYSISQKKHAILFNYI